MTPLFLIVTSVLIIVLFLPHNSIADKCPFDDNGNNCDCTGQDPTNPDFYDVIECTPARGQFQPIKYVKKLTIQQELAIRTNDTSNITIPANAFSAFDSINRIGFLNTQYTTIVSVSLDPQAFDGVNVDGLAFSGFRDLLPLPRAIMNTGSALTTLEIKNGGQGRIAADQFHGFNFLNVLLIINTHIISINDQAFAYVSENLQSLTLSETGLSAFPLKALSPLKNLGHLVMIGNNLRKWPKSAFADLQGLYSLDLSQNYLQQAIDFGTFDNFPPRVIDLKLTHSNLDKIPTELLHNEFSNVRNLNLAVNRIERVQKGDIPSNSVLHLLDLSDNPLRNMDDGVMQSMPAVLHITLDQSMLSSFDLSSLNGLDHLEAVSLDSQRANNFVLKVSDPNKVPQSLNNIWMNNGNIRTLSSDLESIISRDTFRLLDLANANGFICDQNIDWMAKYVVCPSVRILVSGNCANLPGTSAIGYFLRQHPAC